MNDNFSGIRPVTLVRSFLLLLYFTAMTGRPAQAQNIRFSEDAEVFIGELRKVMEGSRNATYIQSMKGLEGVWNSGLNQTQRQQFISLFRNMAAKGHKPGPALYLIIANVQTLLGQQGDVNGFLIALDHAAERYNSKEFLQALQTTQLVLEKKLLYQSNFNKLYLTAGQYRFRFEAPAKDAPATPVADGWDTPVGDSISASKAELPVLAGALLDLQNASFAMVAHGDSVVFGPSTGSVSLHNGIFVGNGGRFDWKSAGDSLVYVQLADYAFKTAVPTLKAEKTEIHDARLKSPVTGVFEYKSIKKAAGKPSTGFPRFISYRNDAVFSEFNKNIAYQGGYYLQGHEMFSSSLSGEPSRVIVSFEGKPVFKTTSQRFSLSPLKVSSELATFTLPLGADSVYHQGVMLRYDDEAGKLYLTRPSKGEFSSLPYIDTYHKMYVWSESARWELGKGEFQFYMVSGKTEIPLRMESMDFFRKGRLQEMSQEFGFQPLLAAAGYLQQQKKQTFHPDELARLVKRQPPIVRRMLERLTLEGYFQYFPDTDEYGLTRRAVFYIMANANKADFDNFTLNSIFPSNEKLVNASISMKDTLMTIRGVERFTISDSLKIKGSPSDRIMVMGKGRDFTMNGRLQSSNFKFAGRNIRFNYNDFFINMTDMDSITYVPHDKYAKGQGGEVGGSIKYDKAGTFYLSDAKNKSGQQKGATGSPRIHIPDGVVIHFDQARRGAWAYPKEVYFSVPELDVGGLDKRDIEFVGEFHSAGILPMLKTNLKSMPDTSLGFEYTLPKEGVKIYEGKALLKAPKLSMDYNGLQSEGNLNYLNGSFQAEKMVLATDSLVASGKSAKLTESTIGGVYFPKADLKEFTMTWLPQADSMLLQTRGNAFDFYNGTTKLEGGLVLRTKGLFGHGVLKRADSELASENIQFKKGGFQAGNATLNVHATAQAEGASLLRARGVDIDFSIDKGVVQLSKKEDGFSGDSSGIELPMANYYTSIGSAVWDTKTRKITMKSSGAPAVFRSLMPEQDSLEFTGTDAVYSVDKKEMSVSGVPYVNSTGLNIVPDKGQVTIDATGQLTPFKKARIVVDTMGISHRMYNADIKIHSKNSLEGSAVYQYITATKDTFDIKLGNFELQKAEPAMASSKRESKAKAAAAETFYTTAVAHIEETDKLRLAPGIAYKGEILFASNRPSLNLDGFIRPMLKERPTLESSWIAYKEAPGANISLKVDPQLVNAEGAPLAAGLHYRFGSGIYPTFLSPKDDSRDQDFFAASGQMHYDGESRSFKITQKNTADTLVPPATVLEFQDTKGIFNFSGKLGFGPGEWVLAAGKGQAQIDSMRLDVNALLGLRFSALTPILPDMAAKIVATNLEEQNNDPAEENQERLFGKLEALIGSAATKVYADKLAAEHKPLTEASPVFNLPIVLSSVNLHWSEATKSFYGSERMGISNLGTNDINAQAEGLVEIRTDAGQEGFSLLLEITPELWYFFDYAENMLGVVSSDYGFNDKVSATKARSKDMQLVPLSPDDKMAFVDKFNTTYPQAKRKAKAVKKTAKGTTQKKESTKKEEKAEGF
ncbi:hypothetical protein GCM10023091_15810 [Ravibacter arvi]|uniref:Uncharacterized protein n=1 Tax=Ravibacter arvi TaxID=2051041 RepID=A0ABP8LVJ1_9BACT